jgi:hypothetical protein
MLTHLQTDLTTVSPNDARNGRAIIVPRPVPFDLVGAAAWRIVGLVVFMAFFPGILIHFVRFRDLIRKG